jgi:hyaluronan synthase
MNDDEQLAVSCLDHEEAGTDEAARTIAARPRIVEPPTAPAEEVLAGGGGDEAAQEREPKDIWAWLLYGAILAGLGFVYYYNISGVGRRVIGLLGEHRSLGLLIYPSALWVVMGLALITFRTIVWMFYRPFPSASFTAAPPLTVVIPAYNEGAMVLTAIRSVAQANYPRDRLEILVIDDGSRDDTWRYICEAAAAYPGLVTALRHERNRGKRAALALGFERARGDILVTLDSDSVIEPDALLALAGPFRDRRIGAVAGKVLVYNRRGLIPRMLHVRFILSFDLLRSVESAYRNVFCCPGALTGLRASAVRGVLGRWKKQRFLGRECTFGEDRALTNYLLEAGYDTVYQRSAVVRTVVPQVYSKLCKMFIRWDRSYVREELRFARIVWKRPLRTRFIALYDRCVTNLRFPIQYASLILLLDLVGHQPHVLVRMLAGTALVSLVNMVYYLRSERSFDFFYGVFYTYFYLFTLFWIFPYALLTVRARSWLTR